MKIKLLYLIGVCVFLHINARAQSPFVKNVTIEDGLLSYDNYCIVKDKNGSIWIGSPKGVVKFSDGSYTQFTVRNGLSTNDNWNLHVDTKNRIWLGNYSKGVQYIENNKVKTVPDSERFQEIYYAGEHADTLFFNVIDKQRSQRYYLANNKLKPYYFFSDKNLNVQLDFREKGLIIYSKKDGGINERYIYYLKDGKSELFFENLLGIHNFHLSDYEKILLIGNEEFIELKESKFVKRSLLSLNQNRNYEDVRLTSDFLMIKSDDKWKYFDIQKKLLWRKDLTAILKANMLNITVFNSLVEDLEHNIWFLERRGEVSIISSQAHCAKGILTDSLTKFDAANPQLFKSPQEFRKNEEFVFQSTNIQLLSINLITKEVKPFYEIKNGIIRAFRFNKSSLLVLSSSYLTSIELSTQKNVLKQKETRVIFKDVAYCMEFIDDNKVLLGNGYVVSIGDNNVLNLSKKPIVEFPFRTFSMVKNGDYLIYASDSEVGILNLKTLKKQIVDIKNPSFLGVFDDAFYVGTDGNGIYQLKCSSEGTTQKHYPFIYGVNSLLQSDGGFYFCTDHGLYFGKFGREKVYLSKEYLNDNYFALDVHDGVVGSNLFLFSNKGIIELNKSFIQKDHYLYKSYSLKVKSPKNGIVLGNGKIEFSGNTLILSMKSKSFFNINELFFRYKLIGIDNNWRYLKKSEVEYTDLPSGDYTFVAQSASNPYGDYGNEKQLKISIAKPYYLKLSFILILVLLIIVITLLLEYYIKKSKRKKGSLLNQLKDLEHKALKAQLNPHFIFNVMNSIQAMVFLNEKEKLNEYICSFSDLLRNVLDNSRKDKITLKEEIVFLENYLFIEKLRIGDSLTYTIDCDANVNQESIEIYGMTIQPFVENCLVHAFLTNQADKNVHVNFYIDDFYLIIEIIDNGIGRKRAGEFSKSSMHKSLGSTILREKSDVLNQMTSKQMYIEIEDVVDKMGVCSGTKVVVKMRII